MRSISMNHWTTLIPVLLLAACGGGGAGDRQPGSGDGGTDPGAVSGGGSGPDSTAGPTGLTTWNCLSADVPAVTLAGAAEGFWRGHAEIMDLLNGPYQMDVIGIVTGDGEARFWLQGPWDGLPAGRAAVGRVGQAPDGTVMSELTMVRRLSGETAARWDPFGRMSLTMAEARTHFRGGLLAKSRCSAMTLTYDDAYDHPVSLTDSAGVYTTSDGSGYTMTVAVDPAGNFNGADTNGCTLGGVLSVRDAAHNYFAASIDVTGCEAVSGRFEGLAVPARGSDGGISVLYLSASREDVVLSFALGH